METLKKFKDELKLVITNAMEQFNQLTIDVIVTFILSITFYLAFYYLVVKL